MSSIYQEPIKCSGEFKTGMPCTFAAKYRIPDATDTAGERHSYFCGNHTPKRGKNYIFRQYKVHANEVKAFEHTEGCKEAASQNATQGKKGDVIITNHVRGEIPQHESGYYAVFVRYGKSKVGWNLSSLDPLRLPVDLGLDFLPSAKNLQLIPLATSHPVGLVEIPASDHVLFLNKILSRKTASSKKINLGQLTVDEPNYRFYDNDLNPVDLDTLAMRALYAKLYTQAVEDSEDLAKLRKLHKEGGNIQIMGAPGTGRFSFPEEEFTWITVLRYLILELTIYPWDLYYALESEKLELFSNLWK